MGFTSLTKDMNIISSLSDTPNDEDGLSPAALKAKFDEAGLALKSYINNTLLPELMGENASEKVGARAIDGVSGENVYAQLYHLKTQLNNIALGALPDNSIVAQKLQNGCVTNEKLSSGVLDLINALYDTKIPTGTILPFGGNVAPNNCIICDGRAVSRTTYGKLYGVIGTMYGTGDGSSTFNVPNLKGKIPVGLNVAETEFNVLGKTGGEKSHSLTMAEMPSHNHSQDAHSHSVQYSGGGNVGLNNGSNGYQIKDTSWDNTGDGSLMTSSTSPNIGYSGGGASHNNLQPYFTVNYMIMAM